MVVNTHERVLPVDPAVLAPLIDGLGSPADLLWPRDHWPPMRFKGELQAGLVGGHGPIRYSIERYDPGSLIRFRFTSPAGFVGYHWFQVEKDARMGSKLRHVVHMEVEGLARISWPLIFRPLHDALIEDALDRAEAFATGREYSCGKWSVPVRLMRWILNRSRRNR